MSDGPPVIQFIQGKYYDPKSRGIEPRTQGIFATCVKGREARCVEELYNLFDKVCVANHPPVDSG